VRRRGRPIVAVRPRAARRVDSPSVRNLSRRPRVNRDDPRVRRSAGATPRRRLEPREVPCQSSASVPPHVPGPISAPRATAHDRAGLHAPTLPAARA